MSESIGMLRFSSLIHDLDVARAIKKKESYLLEYMHALPDVELLYFMGLFLGKRPKRIVKTSTLREWAADLAGLPLWLFEESYHIVGDLAETIALLVPQRREEDFTLSQCYELLRELSQAEEVEQEARIKSIWQSFDLYGRFAFNKILTGSFRIGVSKKMITKVFARHKDLDIAEATHLLMGKWDPMKTSLDELIRSKEDVHILQPYPFMLAQSFDDSAPLDPKEWLAEYKWDGIRAQIIKRKNEISIWSRGEEVLTKGFPQIYSAIESLDCNFVLDGEIMIWRGDMPGSFQDLQKRINLKKPSAKKLEDYPAYFMIFDAIEWDGKDMRSSPLSSRRERFSTLEARHERILVSKVISYQTHQELEKIKENARSLGAEGLMVKRLDSQYEYGRKNTWLKWKLEPYTIDAVLLYAMRGHGRRANLYTDFTFALWRESALVPFTKAYSGLTDAELKEVDQFVKRNTQQRFGPVSQVTPKLVFEIAFERIARSNRHKSGYAVRFPRILRWRKDKSINDANHLADLDELMKLHD